MISTNLLRWINKQKIKQNIKVKITKISKLDKWKYDGFKLSHVSRKFFKIIGIRIKTNFFKKGWDQPISNKKK